MPQTFPATSNSRPIWKSSRTARGRCTHTTRPCKRRGGWEASVLRNLELDRGILGNVMLRLVLAPVDVDHHGGGAFLEWLAERVHARDRDRHGLHDARASALLWLASSMGSDSTTWASEG